MKTLIVYYSRDGHTKILAEELAKMISADCEEIVDQDTRKGIKGWLYAGKDATMKKPAAINPLKSTIESYDLVIIGTPVWAFTMCPAIRTILMNYNQLIKNTIYFATMGGSGDKRTFKNMEDLCKKPPLLTATFIDKKIKKGEHIQELQKFANDIMEKMKTL